MARSNGFARWTALLQTRKGETVEKMRCALMMPGAKGLVTSHGGWQRLQPTGDGVFWARGSQAVISVVIANGSNAFLSLRRSKISSSSYLCPAARSADPCDSVGAPVNAGNGEPLLGWAPALPLTVRSLQLSLELFVHFSISLLLMTHTAMPTEFSPGGFLLKEAWRDRTVSEGVIPLFAFYLDEELASRVATFHLTENRQDYLRWLYCPAMMGYRGD